MVSDLFIHYLQNVRINLLLISNEFDFQDSTTIELYQLIGTNYKLWAAGHLELKQLLNITTNNPRIFGSLTLISVVESVGIPFARLDYCVQLRMPLEKALNLYKVSRYCCTIVDYI
jgi:hypothetical protein